jgi:DNA recombination protein RmuC
MSDILLFVVIGLLAINLVILIIIMNSVPAGKLIKLETRFDAIEKSMDRLDRTLKEEMLHNREELAGSNRTFNGMISSQMSEISSLQRNQLDIFSKQLTNLTQTNENKLDRMRETIEERLRHLQ